MNKLVQLIMLSCLLFTSYQLVQDKRYSERLETDYTLIPELTRAEPDPEYTIGYTDEVDGLRSVEEMITIVFGEDADIAIAIAKAESALNPDAVGDRHLMYKKHGVYWGDSIGVFQIRTFPDRPSREELFDAWFNVNYAYELYIDYGWKPWSAYKNQSYKQFM
jgi:hypothetical protein